jgi:DnaK suppressor protein
LFEKAGIPRPGGIFRIFGPNQGQEGLSCFAASWAAEGKMDEKKQQYLRTIILQRLANASRRAGLIPEEADVEERLADPVDQATEEREKDLSRLFRARENVEIQKLALALDRMEQGSYGICLSCDGDISEKRLMAEPTALLCVHCQEKRERGRATAER